MYFRVFSERVHAHVHKRGWESAKGVSVISVPLSKGISKKRLKQELKIVNDQYRRLLDWFTLISLA